MFFNNSSFKYSKFLDLFLHSNIVRGVIIRILEHIPLKILGNSVLIIFLIIGFIYIIINISLIINYFKKKNNCINKEHDKLYKKYKKL